MLEGGMCSLSMVLKLHVEGATIPVTPNNRSIQTL